MGFEDKLEELGFEGEQIDLDSDADLSMGTGRIRAQRKKGIKTEEVAYAKPRRDRFGRRSDGEESGIGADMLNPDKPTRIAGGFSRREMTPQEVKPLQSENSKFAYLFSEEEEDEDQVSTIEGKAAAVDALSMKGDEADAENVFERETRSVIHSQGKPQRRTETSEQPMQRTGGAGRFSRHSEQNEQASKPAASRFSRRSSAEPVKEEPIRETAPKSEETEPTVQEIITEPAAEEVYTENSAAGEATDAVYADSQTYGYGNPYMYGQYPPPYNPYGGYPPQNPYAQPYPQPYAQQPYPYQYPANYAQPQYIPVGYVFQAGFVPVEMAHGAPQRRRRPSAARSAHRYDQEPETQYAERGAREATKIKAIAAKSEPVQEVIQEPAPEPVWRPAPPETHEEPVNAYESQYDRIVSEIPSEPAAENNDEPKLGSAAPSRFARRGSAERANESASSRFVSRGSAAQTDFEQDFDEPTPPSAPAGGRFNRRG